MSSSVSLKINFKRSGFRRQIFIVVILVIVAVAIAFFKVFGESRDYAAYNNFFEHVFSTRCQDTEAYRFEIGFQYFSCLLSYIAPSSEALYAASCAFSLLPKLVIIALVAALTPFKVLKIPVSFVLALMMYMTRFFPLHELTQLRGSLGIAFILGAFLYMKRNTILPLLGSQLPKEKELIIRNWKPFVFPLILITICIFFHSSLSAFIPLLILQKFAKSKRFILYSAVFVGIVLFVSNNLIANFAFTNFAAGILYEDEFGEQVNLFSVQKMLDWALLILGLLLVKPSEKLSLSLLCLSAYSLSIFYGFASFPVIAHRLSEAIQVFSILFVASMGTRKQLTFLAPYAIAYSVLNILVFTTTDYFS